MHAVKAPYVATFLGHKLTNGYTDEIGNGFNTHIKGACIKQHMGSAPIKMYNEHGILLSIKAVVNHVSFLKHYERQNTVTALGTWR